VAHVVEKLRAECPNVVAVGVGAAGFVDRAGETVFFAPNLVWRDEPLRSRLTSRLQLPCVVENDANAAAWGEYRFGAGIGLDPLVCLTVGTGIGGGIITGGMLLRGGFGIAAEFGHMVVVPEGRDCGCGNRGCWEQYASGNALVREAIAAGGFAADVTGEQVTEAARRGDPVALRCFQRVGGWLGIGLVNVVAVLDPQRIVIGGGVIDAGELLLAPARETFRHTLPGRGYRAEAEIVPALLGPDAGIVGAADLARLAVA
jgi:glucokinase